MKKELLTIAFLLIVFSGINLYSLNNFTYRGVAFDGSGTILGGQSVTVNIQLINSNGVQYEENHTAVGTDQFGGYTVNVGTGTVVQGDLSSVNATKDLRIKSTVNNSGVWVVSSILKPKLALLKDNSDMFWKLAGNDGTTPGTDFVGTTDSTELNLEIRSSGNLIHSLTIAPNLAIFRETTFNGSVLGIDNKGDYSVDLQIYRTDTNQIALGFYSTISGGTENTANGHRSTVGGGSLNLARGESSTVAGGLRDTAWSMWSTVGGGRDNKTSDWAATIAGGWGNKASGFGSTICGGAENKATNNYSYVGAGYRNLSSGALSTVCGGDRNTASGENSFIGGGKEDTTTGAFSFIGAGRWNQADGDYSMVGCGMENQTTAIYSVISGGRNAIADKYAQNAYAGGRFANNGDAQTSLFVVRNETTDATATYLYLDGTSASESMTLNDQDRWIFRALVVGASDDGSNYGSYIVTGYIYRDVGTVTITGVTTTTVAESSASYNATAVVNGTALSIQVTGDATNTMRWVARVEVAQLNY